MRPGGVLLAVAMLATGAARAQVPEAELRFNQGLLHLKEGRSEMAIEEFKQAYAISGAPGLLFNIAQAYRLVGDYKQALYFYKTYIRLQPGAANRADVEARIVEMEKAIEESQ